MLCLLLFLSDSQEERCWNHPVCVILGEFLNFLVPPFLHLWNGANTYLIEILWKLKKLIYVKCLESCLTYISVPNIINIIVIIRITKESVNLPFAQQRSPLAQIEKESSSTSYRPKLPVTTCTILINDFSHRKFPQPWTARQLRTPGTKVGMEEDLGLGSQPPLTFLFYLPARKMNLNFPGFGDFHFLLSNCSSKTNSGNSILQ